MPEADPREKDRDEQEPSPYLRRSRRVEVRRGVRWKRVAVIGLPVLLAAGGVAAAAAYGVNAYLTRSPRFALRDNLAVDGAQHVSMDQVARVFAADAGRSVLGVPLEKRRAQLLALPWIQNAWVLRGWPNRLRVLVSERRPVAFVRADSGALGLIDREGVLLPLPRRGKFPFPVLGGVTESLTAAERRKRVARALAVLEDLDRDIPPRAGEVSEIDLHDPEDAAVTVTGAGVGTAVLVHLGEGPFLERYRYFLRNIETWREQYGAVRSVDLRYEKQVIVR